MTKSLWKKVLIFGLVGIVAGIAITLVMPVKYRVYSVYEPKEDAIESFESLKYQVLNLDFIAEIRQESEIADNLFPEEEKELKKDWLNTVVVRRELENLRVEVVHGNLENSMRLSEVITDKIDTEKADVRLVERAVVDERIASPNSRVIIPITVVTAVLIPLVPAFFQAIKKLRRKKVVENHDYDSKVEEWLARK